MERMLDDILMMYYRIESYVRRKYREYLTKHRKKTHLCAYDQLPFQLNVKKYHEPIEAQDRFLMVGVDDFRPTDLQWVMPLFERYGYRATFNGIASGSYKEMFFVKRAEKFGHEIGDHTFMHEQYPYFSPLYNGYDPSKPDGSNQEPYPSNDDMRADRGDGCNALGYPLNSRVDYLNYYHNPDVLNKEELSFISPITEDVDITWRELSDEQCQRIRDYYSLIKDDKLCRFLDELSAVYIGTYGYSKNSFDPNSGCYTRGIFTDCKTSENHEIWERIMYLQRVYQRDYNHISYDCITWSMPGMKCGDLFYEKNGIRYYDRLHTKPANLLANMQTSPSCIGIRSMRGILNKYGYCIAHDIRMPSWLDGYEVPEMQNMMIRNARFSKPDALVYYGERTVRQGEVREAINVLRHRTVSGVVANAIVDSENDEQQMQFWRQILDYCKKTGVKVITKAEAYDICFNHKMDKGNLIYNPTLRNTIKEYDPTAMDTNPDGYIGNCCVGLINDEPILMTNGDTKYTHYGIPYGKIIYSAIIRGKGEVNVFILRNKTKLNTEQEQIASIQVDGTQFKKEKVEFEISDAPLTDYECRFAGWGDKICGIRIIYSAGLEVKNIKLVKQ